VRKPNPAAWIICSCLFLLLGWVGYELPGSGDSRRRAIFYWRADRVRVDLAARDFGVIAACGLSSSWRAKKPKQAAPWLVVQQLVGRQA
jgi:hypothetical protein